MADENEHVFLLAVVVPAHSRVEAEQRLMSTILWAAPNTECWVAEDDRRDRSDNDSAVFVKPGAQRQATELLLRAGLTWPHSNRATNPMPDEPNFNRFGEDHL